MEYEFGHFNVLTLASFPFLCTAKAQSVESELINCHREEASQLRKVIAQKEDDLHRTVQKYEQVIQVLCKDKAHIHFPSNKTPFYRFLC